MKKDPALCSARSLVTGSEDLAAVAQLYADVAAGRRAALDQKEHAVAARLPRCGDSLGGLLRRGHRLLIDRQYDVAALQALLRRIACRIDRRDLHALGRLRHANLACSLPRPPLAPHPGRRLA